jgi:Cu(I)-responsive transcriptional regulator
MKAPTPITIGQLAKATATKTETIRYYERIGLLRAPDRTHSNYRSYAGEHVQSLTFIRRACELGFSIEDVRELLELAGHRERPYADVDRITARHLATTELKIATLKRLRGELRSTLAACKGGRIADCRVVQALSPLRAGSGSKDRESRAALR